MALTLVHDCPHCHSQNVGFTFANGVQTHTTISSSMGRCYAWSFMFTCNSCYMPVAITCHSHMRSFDSIRTHGNILQNGDYLAQDIFPHPEPIQIPEHIPAHIAENYLDAEYALKGKRWNSAAMAYRRVIELMTKDKLPEAKGNLADRINKLSVTDEIKEWSHELRFIGNDAAHDVENLGEKDALAAAELTYYILTYIYTLPTQIQLAREKE
ncbi:DUF4145 domain-containing protein [Advenella sp. WQ 585]|uniref:DUF4145 domain-containing protein n=1 Tax=Advenella mandrilli TaxID=2800330 RepID=A0ABS1EEF0_9BURK|nr:DUF4145 domain-containing protein [Advenella mandrilli]MBK1780581.1 DUF4145 domain-containing protein [Advenella mandrilli]